MQLRAHQSSFFEREEFPLREAIGYYRRKEDGGTVPLAVTGYHVGELTLLCQNAIAYIYMEETRHAAHLR